MELKVDIYKLLEEIQDIKNVLVEAKPRKLMNIKDVVEYTSLSAPTIRRNMKLGKLKAIKNKGKLLFKFSDVNRWLNG